jgi:orotate phosphoribosyltransferase
MSTPTVNAEKLQRLAELVTELAVVHGRVTLSSGKEADYYVDLRRATLHRESSTLIGELLRELTADWGLRRRRWADPGRRPGRDRRDARR